MWIKIECELATKPKTLVMSRTLGVSRNEVLGGLTLVWGLFAQHGRNGRLDGYTATDLDEHVKATGFSNAMQSVGWLIVGDGFLECPNYTRHNSGVRQETLPESTTLDDYHPLGTMNPILVDSANPNPFGIESDAFERSDWLVIESKFLSQWNKTEGTIKSYTSTLANSLVVAFQSRVCEQGWIASAEAALKKFPLKCLAGKMKLAKFIEPETVAAILAGNYDFDPNDKPGRGKKNEPETSVVKHAQAEFTAKKNTDRAEREQAKQRASDLAAKWTARAAIMEPDEIEALSMRHPHLKVWERRNASLKPNAHKSLRTLYLTSLYEAMELDEASQ